ncbi:MAG: hypothetical protein QXS50_05745 [Candidatus Caldarchaeum sp.]
MRRLSMDRWKEFAESVRMHLGAVLETEDLVLLEAGEDKVRATTSEALETASKMKGVQLVGLYVGKKRKELTTLTIEGCMLIADVDERYVVELTREQALMWMRGGPVKVEAQSRAVLGRYKRFYLGTALVDRLGNAYPQVPLWRRIPPAVE